MPAPTDTPTPTATLTPTDTLTPTPTLTPTATATRERLDIIVDATCPLSAAIIAANTDSNTHDTDCEAGLGDDIIILPSGGTTTLSATLDISSNVTIRGNGHTISGNNAVRVINASSNLSLDNVTIRDGRVGEGVGFSGGGIRISNAIFVVSPTLTITNSAFINNHSSNTGSGGALYIANAGQITITNSTFSGNSASVGGAILLVANFTNRPQANLVHVTVTNSTTRTGGDAAVSFDGQQTGAIRNSIIANNSGGCLL